MSLPKLFDPFERPIGATRPNVCVRVCVFVCVHVYVT